MILEPEPLFRAEPLFHDRRDAGRWLAAALEGERAPELVVVGLARGGVVTAAEVAEALDAPLDVVAVRKVGHPWQPEYAIGAVPPGRGAYIRSSNGLPAGRIASLVEKAKTEATALDRKLHREHLPLDLHGKPVILVDDGLASGATMVAAIRWARAAGAARVLAAVPVAPAESIERVRSEADKVVCPEPLEYFFAVGAHYDVFRPVGDDEVADLVAENRRARALREPVTDEAVPSLA